MPNYTEVTCPYCSRIIRSSDKFCIFCGGRLQNSQPQSKAAQTPKIPEAEQKELEQEVDKDLKKNSSTPFVPTTPISEDIAVNKGSEDKKKSKSEKKSNIDVMMEMPIEIRDQLEAKMNLAILEEKKKKLKKKLTDLSKDLDDERYDTELEFTQQTNLRLEALKNIKDDLSKEEEKWRDQLGGRFKVDLLEDILEEKRQQLIELQRSYKTRKIKKDVYEQLKLEYTERYKEAEKELAEMRLNIIRWLSAEKTDRNKFETKIRLSHARMKASEIEKTQYDTEKEELTKEIEKIDQRVKILEIYSKERPKRLF